VAVGEGASVVDGVAVTVCVSVAVCVCVCVCVAVAVAVSVFVTVSGGGVVVGRVGRVTGGSSTVGRLMLGRDVGNEMEPPPEHAASPAGTRSAVTRTARAGVRLMRDCLRTAPRHCLTRPG
jgi:hypothetical protein